ncbi:hypothetical protein Btru_077145 [Bulinus truncatus]|nr:hypothetical protein Btru_077145 [Bulinus truncatus]
MQCLHCLISHETLSEAKSMKMNFPRIFAVKKIYQVLCYHPEAPFNCLGVAWNFIQVSLLASLYGVVDFVVAELHQHWRHTKVLHILFIDFILYSLIKQKKYFSLFFTNERPREITMISLKSEISP